MRKNLAPFFLCAALASAVALDAFAAETPSGSSSLTSTSKGIQAITKPSDDRTLSFVRPGRVVEVLPKVGQQVKANQIIARQDSTEEEAALTTDKHKAEITDPISRDAEVAVRDHKKAEFARMQDADTQNRGSVAKSELEAARLEVVVADARIKVADDQIEGDKLKIAQTEAAIAKLSLKVPSDCKGSYFVMEPPKPQTLIQVGEIADASGAKVIRIVRVDPLRIDVAVPRAEALKIKPGDSAQVTFSNERVELGTVSAERFLVGDSASSTITVRVELPNPDNLQSGDNVFVKFAPASGVAAKP